jgi:hypothetical protein
MPIVKDLFPAVGFTFPSRFAAWQANELVHPFSGLDSLSEEAFGSIHVQGMYTIKNPSFSCQSITGTTFELLNGQFVSALTYSRFLNSPLLGS